MSNAGRHKEGPEGLASLRAGGCARQEPSTAQGTGPVRQRCGHASWWLLNARKGCIHPSHGGYPPMAVELASGSPATVYVPDGGQPSTDAEWVWAIVVGGDGGG